MNIENAQNNAPASGDEQMHNETVETAAVAQADSTTENNQVEQGTNPAKRVPYDGKKKLARTKADSMATINACNGQIKRVDLRAAFLIKSHHAAKSEFSESSDFEARVNIVIANKKIVSEMSDLKGYQSELEIRKTELLKAAEDEVNEYSFVELSW
jgi:hypothetical protein